MKKDLPSPKITEKEVDHLIADFGVKPTPEKKEEFESLLKKQKEKVISKENQKRNNIRYGI